MVRTAYTSVKNTSMTVSWKSWASLLHLCALLCAAGALPEQFQLQPLNLTVLQGSTVQVNATVQGKWAIMTWKVGGILVLTLSPEGVISSLDRFSASVCSTCDPSRVEFSIHNTTRSEAGKIVCTVEGLYGEKEAQLYVQESGTVSIREGNVTVKQDQQVEFHCVMTAWIPTPTVTWTLNNKPVNSSLYNTTSQADGDSFNSISILKFQAVSNTAVECQATVSMLTSPVSSSVYLVVVPDWTVLIAVVVSFGSVALLVLLIIGIIFCYKRRKEKKTSYQDEMRKVRTQSQLSAAGQRQGQVNQAYVVDGQTSAAPSELNDSGFYQIPDFVINNQSENTVHDPGFVKHRHVTIV